MLYNLELTDDAFPKAEIRMDSFERQVLMPKSPSGLGEKNGWKVWLIWSWLESRYALYAKDFTLLENYRRKKPIIIIKPFGEHFQGKWNQEKVQSFSNRVEINSKADGTSHQKRKHTHMNVWEANLFT